ncbi:MAG: cytochrome C oxidase subunit IV family protein [Acidimicrobiia bacterium]
MTAAAEPVVDQESQEAHQIGPREYWLIAIFLGVITGLEVGATYVDSIKGGWLIALLLVLAAVKFFTVVGWYMHLKYEAFTVNGLFYFGLIGAITLFIVVLLTFRALF